MSHHVCLMGLFLCIGWFMQKNYFLEVAEKPASFPSLPACPVCCSCHRALSWRQKVLFCLFENCIRTCDNWFNYYPHLCLLLKSATLCEMSSNWFPISLKEREETKNNSQGLIAKVWMPTKKAIFFVSESIFIIFVFSESITWALAWSPWSFHCHPFHPAPPFVPPNNKIFRLRWKIFQQDGISQTSEKFFYKDYYNVLVYHRLASPPLQWARQRVFWSLCSFRSPTTRNCSHWPGWSVGLIGIGLARFAVVLFGFQIVRPLFEIF